MAMHLVGFSQSQDTGGNLTQVTPIPDPVIAIQNNNIVVPDQISSPVSLPALSNIIGIYTQGATISRAQLQSPSLRAFLMHELTQLDLSATPTDPPRYIDRSLDPIRLMPNEQLSAFVAETAAGAERETVMLLLADNVQPNVNGDIRTVRCTSATTLVAFAWSTCVLTFDQSLPAGQYQLVGLRARSTGLIAARAVFVGGIYRPGAIAAPGIGGIGSQLFRHGNLGVWGTFRHNTPPQIECFSASADTSEIFELDLLPV